MHSGKKRKCKMYGYLSWYYYFVTIIINIIIIYLNILDIDVFSPAGNQHQVNIYYYYYLYYYTKKNKKKKVILYHADSLYQ